MKKVLLTLIFCGLTLIAKSQSAQVETSVFGIQTGLLGIWVHNEARLSNQIALRSELGLDTGVYGRDHDHIDGLLLAPTITLEPRWYYNLNRRAAKSRRIDGNSGNFISIKTTYHPDLFIISNQDNLNFISDISVIPTWGIRRNLGNHFNYEAGIGIGYVHYFKEDNVILLYDSGVAANVHLRIGYRF